MLHILLNLQQSIVCDEYRDYKVLAIVDRHRKAIVIKPELRNIEKDSVVDFVTKTLPQFPIGKYKIIEGEGFHMDTWDEKLKKMKNI